MKINQLQVPHSQRSAVVIELAEVREKERIKKYHLDEIERVMTVA